MIKKAYFLEKNPNFENQLEDIQSTLRDSLKNNPGRTRREVLKSLLAAGIITGEFGELLLKNALASQVMPTNKNNLQLDVPEPLRKIESVIILGAGLAGLTAAYQLTRAGIPCELFESASRLGGRIFTRDRFNAEGMFCELGGELIDSGHEDLLKLAADLGIAVDDLTLGEEGIETNHYFFGDNHYYPKQALEAFRPLARVLLADMNACFVDPNVSVINYKSHTERAVYFDRMTLKEYLYSKKDVDRWILDLLNVAYLGEYGLDTDQQSAGNLFLMANPDLSHGFSIFGSSDESRRIHGGNSRLIEALAQAVGTRSKIHLESELVKIEDTGNTIRLTLKGRNQTFTRSASQVICTLPFTRLRQVEGLETLGLSPVKLRCIQNLGYGLNSKHMLGFRERPWRKTQGTLPGSTGYTFTDLPTQVFWDSSRAQAGTSGIITNFVGGNASQMPEVSRPEILIKDLEKIYPKISSLYDANRSFFNWAKHPHTLGSYTCPRPGQLTTLIGSPAEPELKGRLLFAGEHVSEVYQGYMNGAVQSANIAAQSIISRHRGEMTDRPTHFPTATAQAASQSAR